VSDDPIVVVDHDAPGRKLVRVLLGAEGHQVRDVETGEAALGVLAATPVKLVITELDLPGMSGVALIRDIVTMPATRHIPVIAITARDVEARQGRAALATGAAACCPKPLATAPFARLVASLLDTAERRVTAKCVRCSAAILGGDPSTSDSSGSYHVWCWRLLQAGEQIRQSRAVSREALASIARTRARVARAARMFGTADSAGAVLCVTCGRAVATPAELAVTPDGPMHIACCPPAAPR
jgi:two-component system, cell cycle response regulator DivK